MGAAWLATRAGGKLAPAAETFWATSQSAAAGGHLHAEAVVLHGQAELPPAHVQAACTAGITSRGAVGAWRGGSNRWDREQPSSQRQALTQPSLTLARGGFSGEAHKKQVPWLLTTKGVCCPTRNNESPPLRLCSIGLGRHPARCVAGMAGAHETLAPSPRVGSVRGEAHKCMAGMANTSKLTMLLTRLDGAGGGGPCWTPPAHAARKCMSYKARRWKAQ